MTAARMAGQARKRGKAVLCAEPVKAALEQSTTNTRVKMSFVGNAVLKGNTEPTNMYVPEFSVEEDFHKLESQHSEDPSLEELSRHSGQTANLEEIVTSIKAILHGAEPMRRTVVIEAELGLGKRALLRQVLTQVERGGSKTGPMPKVIRTRCCSTDSRATYFGTCHQVMLLLCQCCTQGAASIPNLWYEVGCNVCRPPVARQEDSHFHLPLFPGRCVGGGRR